MADTFSAPNQTKDTPAEQAAGKQAYASPKLTCYGPIVEIVRGPDGGAFDAFVGAPGGFTS